MSIIMRMAPSSSLGRPTASHSSSKSRSPCSSSRQTAASVSPRPRGIARDFSCRGASFGSSRGSSRDRSRGRVPDGSMDSAPRMSCAQVARRAPSESSRCGSWEPGLSTRPGSAKTSRPHSSASCAVRSAPERRGPSVTSTPSAMPAMIRLRCRKLYFVGATPGGYSLTTLPPLSMISRISGTFSAGYGLSSAPPRTATVRPPASSAPRCAQASMPSAMPETMHMPAPASSPASLRVCVRP